jgi:hypothetical protein
MQDKTVRLPPKISFHYAILWCLVIGIIIVNGFVYHNIKAKYLQITDKNTVSVVGDKYFVDETATRQARLQPDFKGTIVFQVKEHIDEYSVGIEENGMDKMLFKARTLQKREKMQPVVVPTNIPLPEVQLPSLKGVPITNE